MGFQLKSEGLRPKHCMGSPANGEPSEGISPKIWRLWGITSMFRAPPLCYHATNKDPFAKFSVNQRRFNTEWNKYFKFLVHLSPRYTASTSAKTPDYYSNRRTPKTSLISPPSHQSETYTCIHFYTVQDQSPLYLLPKPPLYGLSHLRIFHWLRP